MLCLFVSVFSLCLPCPALCFDLSVFLFVFLLVFTPFHFDKKGYNHIEKSSDKMCMKKNMWLVWDSQTQSCRCGNELYGKVLCNSYTNDL